MIPPLSFNYAHLTTITSETNQINSNAFRSYHVRRSYEQAWKRSVTGNAPGCVSPTPNTDIESSQHPNQSPR